MVVVNSLVVLTKEELEGQDFKEDTLYLVEGSDNLIDLCYKGKFVSNVEVVSQANDDLPDDKFYVVQDDSGKPSYVCYKTKIKDSSVFIPIFSFLIKSINKEDSGEVIVKTDDLSLRVISFDSSGKVLRLDVDYILEDLPDTIDCRFVWGNIG